MARRKKSGRKRQAKRTGLTAALARAKETLRQEILARTLAELPGQAAMGDVVTSLRSAGFGNDLHAMSLGDFVSAVGGEADGFPRKRAAARRAAPRRAKGRRRAKAARAGTKVNTRTEAGRTALDDAVSAFLKANKSARAEAIRGAVGGSSAQVRQSLARLVAAKQVSKKGQKRGTEYSWGSGRERAKGKSAVKRTKKKASARPKKTTGRTVTKAKSAEA